MKKKKIIAVILLAFAVLAVLCSVGAVLYKNGNMAFMHPLKKAKEGQIKVACVGDSITYGAGIKGWPENSYPYILGDLLGESYAVNNYGYSARTAMSDGDHPYISDRLYKKSLAYEPDIVVMMFGTNDSKPYNWKGKEAFIKDYSALIDSYLRFASAQNIFLLSPPPAFPYNGKVKFDINAALIDGEIRAAVEEIAEAKSLSYLDMNVVFAGKAELFSDGIHLNKAGAELFAQTVAEAIGAE